MGPKATHIFGEANKLKNLQLFKLKCNQSPIMHPSMQTFMVCFAALICLGESKSATKIIGGSEASITDFPYHVLIRRRDDHDCGGSIIDEYHILTAAHCVIDEEGDLKTDVKVISGISNNKINPSTGQIHQPDVISLINNYTVTNRRVHDIAIIKLLKRIVFSTTQRPVSLPTSEVSIGASVTVIGAGWIDGVTQKLPNTLQKLRMTVMSNEECQNIWRSNNVIIPSEHICSWKSKNQGICNGDSGSPMIYQGYIVGVVSYSTTICADGYPDISVRVWAYISWIKNVLAGKPMVKMYYPRYSYKV